MGFIDSTKTKRRSRWSILAKTQFIYRIQRDAILQRYLVQQWRDLSHFDQHLITKTDWFWHNFLSRKKSVVCFDATDWCYNIFVGIRMLDGKATDTLEGSSLSYRSDYIDIYSCCWGPKDDGKRFGKPGYLASKALQIGADRVKTFAVRIFRP